jgi:hypothetical protein
LTTFCVLAGCRSIAEIDRSLVVHEQHHRSTL